VSLLLAAVGIGSGGIEETWGGAWLMEPGDGQAIVYSDFSDSARAFDAEGRLIPVPQYRKFELGTYIEYGLTDWLTLVVAPAYDRISTPPPGQSYNGLGQSEAAARIRVLQNDSSVISFQAGLRSPGASLADSLGPFEVRRAASLELRGLAGRNIVLLGMESFVDAEAAYRFYGGNQPGEWRIDLTMGVRPFPSLLVMLQSFTSITNGTSNFGHVSWTKLQPSFVYNLAPQWSVQLGGFLTVSGINAGRELGPMAGIWYRF
jgi:protein XagA